VCTVVSGWGERGLVIRAECVGGWGGGGWVGGVVGVWEPSGVEIMVNEGQNSVL
jgi:hypothetical protein